MRHLKKLIPTAVVAAAMFIAVNFVSGTPATFADGGNCISWGTEYQSQLVQGAPRWVPWTNHYGQVHWRLVPTSYWTTVPVQVCLSYAPVITYVQPVTTVTYVQTVAPVQTVIYAPQPIYPYAYQYTPWGYLPTAAYYGKYVQSRNGTYFGTPQ